MAESLSIAPGQAAAVASAVRDNHHQDRYELMAEKNPSLEKLRKALDLDLA